MALFVTFEGGEGCGKSLQSRTLFRKLTQLDVPAVLIHEPGGTPLGQKIRYLLKQSCEISVSPLSELLLFNASRSQLVEDVIKPALNENKIVICDRFSDSTLAYQSYGRGLNLDMVKKVNQIASQNLLPDLTFLLDAPPRIGLARKKAEANDRFEKETLVFHEKVRNGFLKFAKENPKTWSIIDATLSRSEISRIIWQKIESILKG
jgi:dTMP kinase